MTKIAIRMLATQLTPAFQPVMPKEVSMLACTTQVVLMKILLRGPESHGKNNWLMNAAKPYLTGALSRVTGEAEAGDKARYMVEDEAEAKFKSEDGVNKFSSQLSHNIYYHPNRVSHWVNKVPHQANRVLHQASRAPLGLNLSPRRQRPFSEP